MEAGDSALATYSPILGRPAYGSNTAGLLA